MVLKKFARTNAGNRSLRAVLARKLVNFKVQFGLIDPEEMPLEDPLEAQKEAENLQLFKEGHNDAQDAATINGACINANDSIFTPLTRTHGQDGRMTTTNPFNKEQLNMTNFSGSASNINNQQQIAFAPAISPVNRLNIAQTPLTPQNVPNRLISTANSARRPRKFNKRLVEAAIKEGENNLPKLTGTVGEPKDEVSVHE